MRQIKSGPHISSSIFTGQVRAIIWDLEGLGFMDSAGIGLILGRMRDLAPAGRGNTHLESIHDDGENIHIFRSWTKYKALHGRNSDRGNRRGFT